MALPSTLVWEVRTTGSDLNGGAFDAGMRTTGTDYSQQDVPQAIYTDLTIDASSATKATSNSRPFQGADVGNAIRIPAGIPGMIAGVYSIRSVSGGVAVLDRACGTAGTSQSLGSIRLGGAISSLSRLASDMVAKNLAFVKSGQYSEPGTVTFPQNAGYASPSSPPTRIIGYSETRSDYDTVGLSRPTITIGGTGTGLAFTTNSWVVQNLSLGGGSLLDGLTGGGGNLMAVNCRVTGFTRYGILGPQGSQVRFCEIMGVSALEGILVGSYSVIDNNYVHDCTFLVAAIGASAGCSMIRNIVANILSGHGLIVSSSGQQEVLFNTIHNVAKSGLRLANAPDPTGLNVRGNLFTKCGRYGIESDVPGLPQSISLDGNAFGGGVAANVLGTKYNLTDDGTTNPVNAYLTYRYAGDVTTNGDPYRSAASGDFGLNSGAGVALKGKGPLRDWPSLSDLGATDFGAVQSGGVVSESGSGGQTHGNYYF